MFILEIVNKDFEGTWGNNICVSEDRHKLENRIAAEKVIYIEKNSIYGHNFEELFLVGELEAFVIETFQQFKHDGIQYVFQDKNFQTYFEVRQEVLKIASSLCDNLGLDPAVLEQIANNGFYQSLRFMIREIEVC